MAAKIEFHQPREDAGLETDSTKEDVGKFWADTGICNEYPIFQ